MSVSDFTVRSARRFVECPLAGNQQLIWIGQQQRPDVPLYEMVHSYSIDGPVDVDRFARAFERFVESHDILRTVASDAEWSTPMTADVVPAPTEFADLSQRPETASEYVAANLQNQFSPTNALYHSLLLRLGPTEYQWVLRLHHILTDGGNSRAILQAMSKLYAADTDVEAPSNNYSDFLASEREKSAETNPNETGCGRTAAWWNERATPVTPRCFYSRRPSRPDMRHVRRVVDLTVEENDWIQQLCSQSPFRQFSGMLSAFNVFATIFSVLLYRLDDQSPVVFGTPGHGRTAGLKDTVGLLMQLLPFRSNVKATDTFEDVSRSVATEVRGFFQHSARSVASPELMKSFDVVLNVVDFAAEDFNGWNTRADWLHNGFGDEHRRLTITAHPSQETGRWQLLFDCNESAFCESDRERLIQHIRIVLRHLAVNPQQLVTDFELLSDTDKLHLDEHSGVARAASQADVWGEFQNVVRRTPHQVAVLELDDSTEEDNSLTFSQLQAAAETIADRITAAVSGNLVPVVCRRDQSALVSFLGVLASGKCFLPIDADLPQQRIDQLLETSGASHWLEASSDSLHATDHAHREHEICDTACYVLYTSGSTGVPNGVVVSAESLFNLLEHVEAIAPVSETCRGGWWTNVGFDVAIYEIFSSLLAGRTLCIPPDRIRNRPAELFPWLLRHNVGSIYLPPFFLCEFQEFTQQTTCDQFERLLVGVEPIPQSILAAISRQCRGLRIINGYGPTEATVCATMKLIASEDTSPDPASIGGPVAGNIVRVVDSSGRDVPPGVAGELLIAGTGLARGYLSNAELTEKRFRKNGESNERWYHTGDRVRFRPDGDLDFLGRTDSQMKVRGHRIEAGEIQSLILDFTDSSDCVVFTVDDRKGGREIAAVVRARATDAEEYSPETIRTALLNRLPRSHVPARIVTTTAPLPRTQNGKPDNAALTKLIEAKQESDPHELPRDEIEKRLYAIWVNILEHEEFGVTQSFFEIGGDSLSAINVVGELEDLGVDVAMSDVFRYATIRELARRIEHLQSGNNGNRVATPSSPAPRASRYRLTPAQEGLWAFAQQHSKNAAYNVQLKMRLPESLDKERLRSSVQTLTQRHDVLRSGVVLVDGSPCFKVNSGTAISLAFQELSEDAAVETIQAEASVPFDLKNPPLLRILQINLPDGCWLVLTGHHLAVDQHAAQILLQELSELYDGRTLPPVRHQAADFADWKHRRSQERRPDCLSFWRKAVSQCPSLPIRTRRNRNLRDGFISREVPPELSAKLRDVAAQLDVSMHNLLLTAFQVLQYRYHGGTDFVIGLPVSQRSRFPDVVGYLIETVPFPCRLKPDRNFSQLSRETDHRFLETLDHLDLPLNEIRSESGLAEVDSSEPAFHTMFVMNRQIEVQFSGARAQVHVAAGEHSKFDLTLFVSDDAEALSCGFEYRGDVFDQADVEQLATQWENLLMSVVADSKQPITQLEVLTSEELNAHERVNRNNQLSLRPDTANSSYPPVRITDLLDDAAASHLDAIAVSCGEVQISYRELHERAGRVADALRGGVGEGLVGLCCDSSAEMLVGLVGILKAGFAYVPMDPDRPTQKLQQLLQTSGVTTIFTSSQLAPDLEHLGITVITENDQSRLLREPRADTGNSPAYVIHTSGSTGEPNGVEVSHSALIASTLARSDYYKSSPKSFLLLSPVWFDSSVAGIFWTLSTGGTLVLPTASQRNDVHSLGELIHQKEVTHTLCIPSFYKLLLDHARSEQLESFEAVIVAGEECRRDVIEKHQQRLPEAKLFNEYGPAEASVWATVTRLDELNEDESRLTIGRAAPGCDIRLLSDAFLPVPIGVVGEIFIGGERLADGYRNNERLTRQRFVDLNGSRFYRTGDLASLRPDGNLEFRGRRDNQVKVNGQRIEIGEIEAALAKCPGVEEVVVGQVDLPPDISPEALTKRLATLPETVQEQLLKAVSPDTEPQRETHEKTDDRFSVQLAFRDAESIAPPRDRQRKWLLDQAVAETLSDLNHLDAIAPQFVPGDPQPHAPADLSLRRMSEQEIMEDWQTPMMQAMAEYTCRPGDDVLEIGFGRGVAASFIQQNDVASHTIVEMNPHSISDFFHPWRGRFPDRDIRLVEDRWQDSLSQLDTYDAVFFHAFPMNEQEFLEYVVNSSTFAEHFFPTAASLLRPGGRFTYMSTEIDSLARRHQRSLFEHFDEVHMRPQQLAIPQGTRDAWWANSMVVVRAIRNEGAVL